MIVESDRSDNGSGDIMLYIHAMYFLYDTIVLIRTGNLHKPDFASPR